MITHEQFIKNVKNKNPKADDIEIIGKYNGSNNPIDCRCKIDGYEWSPVAFSLYRAGCPACTSRIVIKGINDLWTTHPHIAKLLTNPEDGYTVTAGTHKKKSFTCPNCDCHNVQNVNNVTKRNHMFCPSCDDNVSIPNKIMYNLLSQLNIDFVTEKSFDWGINKNGNKARYDFYIESESTLIEMNGIQHYIRQFHEEGRTLEEEQENDELKKNLALSNGIKNYIIIDARISDYEFIKENILHSELSTIYNLKDINWENVFADSSKSFVFEISKLWNEGMGVSEICKKIRFARNIVRDYLYKGTSVNLCDYTPEESSNRKKLREAKKVVCIEDKLVYESIEETGRAIDVSANSVRNCCDLKKENLVSIKKKHYLLVEDFLNMTIEELVKILKKPIIANSKPLFCIEENRIFNNIKEIGDWCGAYHNTINKYLSGKRTHAGIHPITNEELHWREVTDNDVISAYDLCNLKEILLIYE